MSATPRARRRALIAALVVMAVGLVHRTALFVAHRTALDAQLADNPLWSLGQHLPLPMLRDHLLVALLLLQQTPPFSNLVIGLLAKATSWPTGLTYALIALQGVLSIVTALVLQRLLARCSQGRIVGPSVVAVAFLLSTDLVVLEYNSLGQSFYENLGMLLALAFAYRLCVLAETGRPRDAAWAGVLAAALPLTRATWSFVAVPASVFVALATAGRRRAGIAAFLVPVLLLHGGWAVKNAVVYGRLTPVTSSWTGYNLYNGLRGAGLEEPFRHFVVARGEPPWLVEMVDPPRLVPWPRTPPTEPQERDRAIAAWSGIENPLMNGTLAASVFRELERAFTAFAWAHPVLLWKKTGLAYRLFWTPPAAYGRIFLALFCLDSGVPSGLDPAGVVGGMLAGRLPARAYVVSGRFGRGLTRRPVDLWTLRWLEPAWLLAEVAAFHVLAPLLLAVWCVRRLRHDPAADETWRRALTLTVCWALAAYLALVSSVGECCENMRFRLGAEPLIWAVTALAWSEAVQLLRTWNWRSIGRRPASDGQG